MLIGLESSIAGVERIRHLPGWEVACLLVTPYFMSLEQWHSLETVHINTSPSLKFKSWKQCTIASYIEQISFSLEYNELQPSIKSFQQMGILKRLLESV